MVETENAAFNEEVFDSAGREFAQKLTDSVTKEEKEERASQQLQVSC